ncbi:MAG: DUF192 domain-containing protein [Gammaproteobacteria bacterium]|nr:DUF192 domain-containing protein [Rhodocyclaceae bacterium]MBU3908444.1 DUF192 domain-containing protein [Gammaproteobacteria bacterium]MBU3989317.1 DUF192 domain-containing protein [Gammaproteobacteria bacterium]MBU4005390.1 DUF192 domain-containing protein [Gammaproteobacteria bacterium]MBU4021075.1 DUF192 domain-containing protein [Gammaproteobacteria bacterium]
MKQGFHFLVTLGALLFAALAAAQGLPIMELQAGFHRIEAEVANTPQTRSQGLMQRRAMAQQRGMLFVFTETERHCMWMKNTFLPLSVAFLDADGRIINVADMQPHSEDNHCAARPARYALEMNVGWFARRGLKPGDAIGGIERAPQAR